MTPYIKTIAFNTGREYSPEGQLIKVTATQVGEWDEEFDDAYFIISFQDFTRGIDGRFLNVILDKDFTDSRLKDKFMQLYDNGEYV